MRQSSARIAAISGRNLYVLIFFVAAGALSFYLRYRISPVLTADYLRLLTYAGDSAAYLRVFDLAIDGFPRLPANLDYYSNYPWGLKSFLPPVWPFLLAALSLPPASLFSIEPAQAAGLVMLLLSVAIAIPVYFLARELFGKQVGLVSAAIALFHLDFALLGPTGVDHHIADVFLVASVFALFFLARANFAAVHALRFVAFAALGGGLIAISMLISLSLVLIIGMLVLPAAVATFVLSKQELRPLLASLAALFGFAALILGLLALTTSWFAGSLEFSRLSVLQIAIFGAIALLAGAGLVLIQAGQSLRNIRILAAGAILVAAGIVFASPSLLQPLHKGYLRSIGSYPLGMTTRELAPFFSEGLNIPVKYFSYFFFIAPLTVLAMAFRDIRKREVRFEQLFLYVMLALLLAYTMQALYYSIYLSILVVIIYAVGVSWVAHWIAQKVKPARLADGGKNTITAFGTVLIVVAMVFGTIDKQPLVVNANLEHLAEYVRTETASPGAFLEPALKPAYGVIIGWEHSYQMEYLAARATVSTGNTDAGVEGIIAATEFMQFESEDAAYRSAGRLNAKYVVVGAMPLLYSGDLSKLCEPLSRPSDVVFTVSPDRVEPERLHNIMGVRMLWDVLLPQETIDKAPLRHFRLAYISDVDSTKTPFLLYEVVKGAGVRVKAMPGAVVEIATEVQANNGQMIGWRDVGEADKNGVFHTVVPYATLGNNSAVKASPYRLSLHGFEERFDIDETAVQEGREIIVQLSVR